MILLLAALALCSGCFDSGGSSDGGSSSDTSRLSGNVVDGYVNGARVTVYNSNDLSPKNRIGRGITDEQGRFDLTLSVGRIPYPLYIKTEGGTDVETGLPAPSMLYIGEDLGGEVVITPLTDMHYKLALKQGLVAAEDGMVGTLNNLLDNGVQDLNTIFGDPEQNGQLKDALNRVLASGTQTGTLTDGNYTVVIAHMDNTQVNSTEYTYTNTADFLENNVAQGSLTVDGHSLNGQIGGMNASGHIQGGNFILDINAASGLIRLAGNVGLMGSAAGTFIDIPSNPGTLSDIARGPFAASFVPEEGLQAGKVQELAGKLYTGNKNILFRDTLGQDYDIGVASNLEITDLDPDTLEVNATDFNVFLAPDDSTNASVSFTNGTLIRTNSGQPTSLVVLEFEEPNSDRDFFIQPIGLRQAFYFVGNGTTGEVYAAGEAYLSSSNSATPHLEMDSQYDGAFMALNVASLKTDRDIVLSNYNPSGYGFVPPDIDPLREFVMQDGMIYGDSDATSILNGGMLGLYKADAMDSLNTSGFLYAQRAIMEIFETGALQGTGIFGNSEPDLINFPCPYVGFADKADGQPASSFNGSLDFLYRILYVTDEELPEIEDISYAYGTIDISEDSAVLSYTDSQGETGQAELTVNGRDTGLYHLHGPIGPTGKAQYTDIFWPVGGTKAALMVSGGTGTNEPIVELGEAFITF
jgi:hypothetical protein